MGIYRNCLYQDRKSQCTLEELHKLKYFNPIEHYNTYLANLFLNTSFVSFCLKFAGSNKKNYSKETRKSLIIWNSGDFLSVEHKSKL